jgi:hypothetical protein
LILTDAKYRFKIYGSDFAQSKRFCNNDIYKNLVTG